MNHKSCGGLGAASTEMTLKQSSCVAICYLHQSLEDVFSCYLVFNTNLFPWAWLWITKSTVVLVLQGPKWNWNNPHSYMLFTSTIQNSFWYPFDFGWLWWLQNGIVLPVLFEEYFALRTRSAISFSFLMPKRANSFIQWLREQEEEGGGRWKVHGGSKLGNLVHVLGN